MAYNEIRTINNIQLEDIKAREEIEATKKNISSLQTKEDFDNTVGNWSSSHPNETITNVVDGIKIPDVSSFVTISDFNTKQEAQDKVIDTKADKGVVETLQSTKADKSDLVNGLHYVGTTTYSALPTSGNNVGDFYYVTDGDGTNGEGNYAWNGTAWYFSGKTTDFGDISTKVNTAVNNAAFDEGKLKVTKNDGTSTETEVIDSSLTKSDKAADAKITGDKIGQLKEDIENVENVSMSVISDIHHGIYKKLYDTINVYYVSDGTSKPTSACRGLKYHIVGKYIRLRGELGGDNPSVAQYAWGTFSSWATNAWTYYTDSKAVDAVLEVPNGESFLYINVVPEKIDSIQIDVYGDTKNNNVLGVDVTVVTPINELIKPMHQMGRLSGADKQYLTITKNDLDNNCYTISINNTTNSQIIYTLGGGADPLLTNKVHDKAYFVLEYTCNNEDAITVSAAHISEELPRNYVFKQGLNVVYGSINNANARVSFGVAVKPNQQVSINITKIAYIFDNNNISYNDVVRYATTWTSWVDYKRGTHKLYKPVSDNSAIKAYSGKTWVKYGDSLSALPWGNTIAEKLGMTMINKSIGGTRATYTGSSATNDNAGCAISRLQTLPEKIDVITIGFGANDWSGTGVEIGSLPDHVTVDTELDNTVFIDAMLIILKYICTNYPEATVILITPPFGFGVDNMGNPGKTKLDYGNAIKEIAQRFGCGLVDWYKDMGVNIYNYSHFFDGDDLVHFNVNGQKRMESLIYAELVRLANISL